MDTECRIYAACLAAYNSGRLHGAWITVSGKSADDVQAEIDAMLAASPAGDDADEWDIHDHEGWCGWKPDTDVDELVHVADAIAEGGDALTAALSYAHDFEHAEEMARERFLGVFDSLEEWAIEHLSGAVDSVRALGNLAIYFDYAAYGRDAELSGGIIAIEHGGQIYVFANG